MEEEKNKLYNILKKNEDDLLSLNSNMIAETIIIEVEME